MLSRLCTILLAVSLLLVASEAGADGLVSHVYAGISGVWLDGPGSAFPSAVEAGGSGSASISPHLSLVGEAFSGLSEPYVRWSGGGRATFTDADNPDFNTFVGIRFRGGSASAVQPNEWAPDAGFGWRPLKGQLSRLLVGGDAGYGLTSKRMLLSGGLRWEVPLK